MIVHDKRNPKGDFSSLAFVAMNKTLVALFREIFMSSVQLSPFSVLYWGLRVDDVRNRLIAAFVSFAFVAARLFFLDYLSCGPNTNGRISRWIRHHRGHGPNGTQDATIWNRDVNREKNRKEKLSLEQTRTECRAKRKMLRKQINYRGMFVWPLDRWMWTDGVSRRCFFLLIDSLSATFLRSSPRGLYFLTIRVCGLLRGRQENISFIFTTFRFPNQNSEYKTRLDPDQFPRNFCFQPTLTIDTVNYNFGNKVTENQINFASHRIDNLNSDSHVFDAADSSSPNMNEWWTRAPSNLSIWQTKSTTLHGHVATMTK